MENSVHVVNVPLVGALGDFQNFFAMEGVLCSKCKSSFETHSLLYSHACPVDKLVAEGNFSPIKTILTGKFSIKKRKREQSDPQARIRSIGRQERFFWPCHIQHTRRHI